MFNISDMPRKTAVETEQISVRLAKVLMNELRAIGAASGFTLTLTQLLDRAVREYVERHKAAAAAPPRKLRH